ncbi:hypothetical protein [Agarilytica rhodophyticola]|uniref:hypothetical protein n=1 Tax=Agarilytica rhodophyticola TaxID=1737490 RepID=UPI000B342E01|nr:hypothetical protein [Agarilytica rhodophyticola]
MNGRIGHLHCRFLRFDHLTGNDSSAGALSMRLQRVAASELAKAVDKALAQAFDHDDKVYVIRQLKHRSVISEASNDNDLQLANKWGEGIAGALVRKISARDNSTEDLMVFRDQAEFVARFIQDYLDGQAWQRWYFGAFNHLAHYSKSDALYRVLIDNRNCLTAVISELAHQQLLNALFQNLQPWQRTLLWHLGFGTTELQRGAVQSLGHHFEHHWLADHQLRQALKLSANDFAQLCRCLSSSKVLAKAIAEPSIAPEQLQQWLHKAGFNAAVDLQILSAALAKVINEIRPSLIATQSALGDAQTLSGNQQAKLQVPVELAVSNDKDHTLFSLGFELISALDLWQSVPPSLSFFSERFDARYPLDWRDRESLTHYMEDIVDQLREQGYLRQVNPQILGAQSEQNDGLKALLKNFDWLDIDSLLVRMQSSAQARSQATQTIAESNQHPIRTTAKQRQLFQDLSKVIDANICSSVDAATLKITLYARLVKDFPRWQEDTFAMRVVDEIASLAVGAGDNHLVNVATEYLNHLPGQSPHSEEKQQRLLNDLRQVLKTATNFTHSAAENKDNIYAELIAQSSQWCGDSLALGVVETIGEVAVASGGQASHNHAQQLLTHFEDEAEPVLAALFQQTRSGQMLESACAGTFLLLRTMADIRLPAAAQKLDLSFGEQLGCKQAFYTLLIPLMLRLAGPAALEKQRIEPALASMLGPVANMDWHAWQVLWQALANRQVLLLEMLMELWRTLAGQRVLTGRRVYVHRITIANNSRWVIGEEHCWFYWCEAEGVEVKTLIDTINSIYGPDPQRCVLIESDDMDDNIAAELERNRQALLAALEALCHCQLEAADSDLSLNLVAIALLRAWSYWLPRFANSSTAYLLENLIRRQGALCSTRQHIDVSLAPAPLDVVLEMSGYLNPLEKTLWLEQRDVTFNIRA